jgi:hypothetical protein
MQRPILWLVFGLWFIGVASAQMNPQYGAYWTMSVDQNNNLYVSSVVDGTTSPCSGACLYAQHQGQVYVKIGSSGGWVYGPYINPSSYMSVTNQRSIVATPGVDYSVDADGYVYCTLAGWFFSDSVHFDGEVAYTRADWLGTPAPSCYTLPQTKIVQCSYTVVNNCTAATTPPDNDFTGKTIGDRDYRGIATYLSWMNVAACYRFVPPGGSWTCLHGLAYLQGINSHVPPFACTHNP